MRKTTYVATAAVVLILAGIVRWAAPGNRSLEAQASTAIEAQIDTFNMMSNAKNLPTQEFQDFSFVFSAPVREDRSSVTP